MVAFQMPVPVKITGRLSSVTNSFVNGIIPAVKPADAEVIEALAMLGMTPDNVQCTCRPRRSEVRHFQSSRPSKRLV